jgi:hypothetical protein
MDQLFLWLLFFSLLGLPLVIYTLELQILSSFCAHLHLCHPFVLIILSTIYASPELTTFSLLARALLVVMERKAHVNIILDTLCCSAGMETSPMVVVLI